MKRILIVDVPDEHHIPYIVYIANRNNGKAFFRSEDIIKTKFTKFTPPSDEEIEAYALENVPDEDSLEVWFEYLRKFQDGANWLKSLLK